METPIVDQNQQCPECGKFYMEGSPLAWHFKAKHGPKADEYHKLFMENRKRVNPRAKNQASI